MTETQPRFSSVTRCGHCGNVAPMSVVASYSDLTKEESPEHHIRWEEGSIYELLQCLSCTRVTLRSYYWHDGYMESEADVDFQILYPSVARVPVGLPTKLQNAYSAAMKVRTVDSNAFGVLIGRVIEMVFVDRNAQGRFLTNKLQDLAKKGEIPDRLVGVAAALVKLRNVGAHAELGELTTDEVPILEDLCRALLDYVYTAPFLAEQAERKINAVREKRNAGEKNPS